MRLLLILLVSAAVAQEPLDPTAAIQHPRLQSELHRPLPEQYIWTQADAVALTKISYNWQKQDYKADSHFFRRSFQLTSTPKLATLYIAGPRSVRVFLNGKLVDQVASDLDSPLGVHVFTTDVSRALSAGSNTLALEAVRGRGIVSASNSAKTAQLSFGEILVAKIVPAAKGVDAPPFLLSDGSWKSTLQAPAGWEQPAFDDRAWPAVQSLGGIESDMDFFQWSADAGLCDWPGYDGISPFLARYSLSPAAITHVFQGRSSFTNPDGLRTGGFSVNLAALSMSDLDALSLMLDFGREVVGRVEFVSDSGAPADVVIQYGESEQEALSNGQYLGVNKLTIPPRGTAHGPKSAFRYVRVRFVSGVSPIPFRTIRLDGIYYPVQYKGAFESSDPLLNRIWTVGAYTAHLCMQDDIWDAPKRDRGRWMGDVDVSGHVINKVFADQFLMESTMSHLIGPEPVDQHLNGIAGYSAFWITGEADYYRHAGNRKHLESIHQRLIQLQRFMDTELDERDLYINRNKSWPFVDWSPDLYGDTPETRRATEFEFYKAYREGAYLLRELGDTASAAHFEERAAVLASASEQALYEAASSTYGPRWQTNAMAVLSGIAKPERYPAIWQHVLSAVGHEQFSAFSISPYYNYYVVSAMSRMDHRADALSWIRKYWGGMLEEGATSFWESYDLNWPKKDYHVSLQADGTAGFFVSLAHGWSSGPTAWLMEEVLGIKPSGKGFDTVTIRPDLLDLEWAKGTQPTPHGPIQISVKKGAVSLDLPDGIEAEILIPAGTVTINGQPVASTPAENGARARIVLRQAGHFEIHS